MKLLQRIFQSLIVRYLWNCGNAFHDGPYGHGTYVVQMSEEAYHWFRQEWNRRASKGEE